MTQNWNLTPREAEVMTHLVACGGASKVAAGELKLSPKTVDIYVGRAAKRMGARTRLQALLAWDREHRCCPLCFVHRLEAA